MSTQGAPANTETPAPAPHTLAGTALTLVLIAAAIPVCLFVIGLAVPAAAANRTAVLLVGALQLISVLLTLIALCIAIAGFAAIRKEPARYTGQNKAAIAIWLGTAMVLFWAWAIFVLAPAAQQRQSKANELTALRLIGNAMIAYGDDYQNHLPLVPTQLKGYLHRMEFQTLMQGSLNPAPTPLPTRDADLPADIAPYAKMDAQQIPVGAYRFGGYWFVVHGNQSRISAPSQELLAFSRRFDKDQEGRGVLMADTSVRWLAEAEFRAQLEAVNKRRTSRGMKAIEVDD